MATDITAFPIETKKISELATASTLDGSETLTIVQSSSSKKATIDQIQDKILTSNLITVADISDLPASVAGVITLLADTTYLFTKSVDLAGDRLVAVNATAIIGLYTESCKISSTGLTGNALITSNYSLGLKNISLEAETPFTLDASANANQALDWQNVNLVNCTNQGTIKTYDNFIGHTIGVLGGSGFSFDGTIGTISFTDTIFNTGSSQKAITLAATLTISRRCRIVYSSFVILSGETGVEVVSGATIPAEGLILDTVNFAGGGTYLSGVLSSDDEARFTDCRGISNSLTAAQYYMNNNATATTISVAGTYYKVAGTTSTGSIAERFTLSSNRATYKGALTTKFKITICLSFTANNGKEIRFRVAKNGTTIASTQMTRTVNGTGVYAALSLQDIEELQTNDYIELFTTNITDTNSVTVSDLNVIVQKA